MADTTVDSRTATQAFTRAVGVAVHAPSVNNSQPWWWRLTGEVCELRAQRDRQLSVSDPDGRLLHVSCGTALHHARVALAGEGWRLEVDRLPEPGKPNLLARLRLTGQAEPDVTATRLSHAAYLRYTDRRPLTPTRVDDEAISAITAAAEAEGAKLYELHRDQLVELAAVATSALEIEQADNAWLDELAYWTCAFRPPGTGIPAGTGVPPGAIPERSPQTLVPNRDYGQLGSLTISNADDRAASFCVLYGATDEPTAWLPAGEALSAAWLTATDWGVSVLPMGAPVEITSTREALHQLISAAGCPYLVLRLGIADPKQPSPEHTPRLPIDEILSIAPPRRV